MSARTDNVGAFPAENWPTGDATARAARTRPRMTMQFFRHGDRLTVSAWLDDPIYLAEPFYLTRSYQASMTPINPAWNQVCRPARSPVRLRPPGRNLRLPPAGRAA